MQSFIQGFVVGVGGGGGGGGGNYLSVDDVMYRVSTEQKNRSFHREGMI